MNCEMPENIEEAESPDEANLHPLAGLDMSLGPCLRSYVNSIRAYPETVLLKDLLGKVLRDVFSQLDTIYDVLVTGVVIEDQLTKSEFRILFFMWLGFKTGQELQLLLPLKFKTIMSRRSGMYGKLLVKDICETRQKQEEAITKAIGLGLLPPRSLIEDEDSAACD